MHGSSCPPPLVGQFQPPSPTPGHAHAMPIYEYLYKYMGRSRGRIRVEADPRDAAMPASAVGRGRSLQLASFWWTFAVQRRSAAFAVGRLVTGHERSESSDLS